MLDKEIIGKWIRRLKLPLAIYLEDNLKPSGPDWFKERVVAHIRSPEMGEKLKISGDITPLDEAALLDVFLANLEDISTKNKIPRSFKDIKDIIYKMKDIRNKYLGHESLIIEDINITGYQDLDILIVFAEQINAAELKEKFQKERDNEIVRLAKNIQTETAACIEPIESKKYEADILSVSAAKTYNLIEKYLVHSCPNTYRYKKTKYITFRLPPPGEMNTVYEIQKELLVPANVRNNLEYFDSKGLTPEEMDRLLNYIDGNPFTRNDRFYLLSRWETIPEKRKPNEYTSDVQYYSIDQFLTDKEQY